MPCYNPITVYRSTTTTGIKYKATKTHDQQIKIACYYCIGCRLERSRQWAIRIQHEAKMHEKNCFITLTYNEENLPENKSLRMRDFQLFMKKLRKKYGKGIRFYHCGEYGEKYKRPHYHACIFGHDFEDKKAWKQEGTEILYVSEQLQKLWNKGYTSVGRLTFESAAYVARYCTKKIYGKNAQEHYPKIINKTTGEILKWQPEYATMSRRPGIGTKWYENYKEDIYPSDELIIRGKKMKPPKYYDRKYEIDDPKMWEEIKTRRELKASEKAFDNTPKRLKVKQTVTEIKQKQIIRKYEQGET